MSAEQQDTRCAHCGHALTVDEREFYGNGCERCETELHHAMQDDRAPVLPPPPSEVERLLAENARLRIAFHDAIRRPLGVTPDSGAEFYDPRMADEAEERRRLARLGGRHPYQPHKLYPHLCGQCGYPEREALMHLPTATARSEQQGGAGAA
ncbi:hypothetical protein R1A27_28665 [Methylobacterium sp. NMS12]|uniref:hypothetical protein n=1 Tax=Methylobacterium sp. NMS12 TaxID=3079766 RepID=UPI003F8807A2